MDKNGEFIETAFDVFSAGLSISDAIANPSVGNIIGAVVDVAAVVIPRVPGGVGAVKHAGKAAGAAVDAGRGADAGRAAGAAGDAGRGASNAGEAATGASNATSSAQSRAQEIHGTLDSRAQNHRTTAVTETKEGARVVSSSENRLTPAQRAELRANEVEGVGKGHAETTGINAAKEKGLTPTGTAASRGICDSCTQAMEKEKVVPLSPRK